MPDLDRRPVRWPRRGGLLAPLVALAPVLAAASGRRPEPLRGLALLNVAALLAHQFEEYAWPGWFPGHFNGGVCRSARPDRHPLNTRSAFVINVVLGYPFQLAPVVLPRARPLGLAPALLGLGQVVVHGVVSPRRAGRPYSPGVVTAVALHLPIGVAIVREHRRRAGGVDAGAWAATVAWLAAAVLGGVVGTNLVLRDEDSPYRFPTDRLGPYA